VSRRVEFSHCFGVVPLAHRAESGHQTKLDKTPRRRSRSRFCQKLVCCPCRPAKLA
jgi:hypothetical protein